MILYYSIGLGVIGVAVKPVLGVADGISSTMQGISYNVGDYRTPEVIRGPRHLQALDGGISDILLDRDSQQFVNVDKKLIGQKIIIPLSVNESFSREFENEENSISERSPYVEDEDTIENSEGKPTITC